MSEGEATGEEPGGGHGDGEGGALRASSGSSGETPRLPAALSS